MFPFIPPLTRSSSHNHIQFITRHVVSQLHTWHMILPLWQVSSKTRLEKPENQNQVDSSAEDHSPVEEIPVEQTRVYQNQPGSETQENPNLPVQVSTRPTPKSPSESAVLQKTRLHQNVKKKPGRNKSKPDDMDQNWIDDDERILTQRPYTNVGFDGNGAIWVTDVTEQPGFLFPVARSTTLSTIRRQITEEASLSELPHQVVNSKHNVSFFHNVSTTSILETYKCNTWCWNK